MDKRKIIGYLKHGCHELGIGITAEQIEAFFVYLTELKKWNTTYNLTGIKKDEDIVIKHFLDSMLYLHYIPEKTQIVADIGSGAGFPGVPIQIIRPELDIYLVESSIKKSLFLRHLLGLLDLRKTTVLEKRIEKICIPHDIVLVDVAVTRAVFSLGEFVESVSRCVKKGGILIHSKGPKVMEEVQEIKSLPHRIIPRRLPLTDIERNIVVIELSDKHKRYPPEPPSSA